MQVLLEFTEKQYLRPHWVLSLQNFIQLARNHFLYVYLGRLLNLNGHNPIHTVFLSCLGCRQSAESGGTCVIRSDIVSEPQDVHPHTLSIHYPRSIKFLGLGPCAANHFRQCMENHCPNICTSQIQANLCTVQFIKPSRLVNWRGGLILNLVLVNFA